ncbi:hypothetical protein ACFQWF_26645 [Methylorubrum suomiense]
MTLLVVDGDVGHGDALDRVAAIRARRDAFEGQFAGLQGRQIETAGRRNPQAAQNKVAPDFLDAFGRQDKAGSFRLQAQLRKQILAVECGGGAGTEDEHGPYQEAGATPLRTVSGGFMAKLDSAQGTGTDRRRSSHAMKE